MTTDWVARGIAASSLLVALVGLIWAVVSWTRAGPQLRVQALAYRELLEIRIFNTGRTPNTVANVVMNGRPDGGRAIGLAEKFELPERLEPGESITVHVNRDEPIVAPWWKFVRGGWSDVWVLAGSMHQYHVAILPVAAIRPPAHGWRFPPRGSTIRRSVPLAIGTPLIALAAFSGSSQFVQACILLAGMALLYRGLAVYRSKLFARRRLEWWTLVLAIGLSCVELAQAVNRSPDTPVAMWEIYLIAAYMLAAWTLARAGGPTMIQHFLMEVKDGLHAVRSRLRRHRSGT